MDQAGKKGVLVVEDDRDLRTLFGAVLAAENFVVFEADDGLIGLKTLQDHSASIDVVLTDMGIPGIGGLELIARVREAKPSVKIIGTSGFGASDVREMAMRAGADEFFPKPFAVSEVIEKLKRLTL